MKNTAYKIPIKERISLVVEKTLNQCLKIPAFQRYVNRKANNKYGMFITGGSEIDDVIMLIHAWRNNADA